MFQSPSCYHISIFITLKNSLVMKTKIFIILSFCLSVAACGGGSSDSGATVDIPKIDLPPTGEGTEFKATQCVSVSLDEKVIKYKIVNSCAYAVNVREIKNDSFGPNYLIKANSTIFVDRFSPFKVACKDPYVPGGIAKLLSYSCSLPQ